MSFYEIIGTITGNYATEIIARAYDLASGELLGEDRVISGQYRIPIGDDNAQCFVTFIADVGRLWASRHHYPIGALIYPSAQSGVFYYFKCIEPGNSGNIEPSFSSDPLVRHVDGSCAWVRVEGFPPPQIVYPVTPSVSV